MKILTVSDIKDSKNLLGCFGYFGNVPFDLADLDVAFYGQLTEFPLDSFFGTPDSDTGGTRNFLFFLPESSVQIQEHTEAQEQTEQTPETIEQKIDRLADKIQSLSDRVDRLAQATRSAR